MYKSASRNLDPQVFRAIVVAFILFEIGWDRLRLSMVLQHKIVRVHQH